MGHFILNIYKDFAESSFNITHFTGPQSTMIMEALMIKYIENPEK